MKSTLPRPAGAAAQGATAAIERLFPEFSPEKRARQAAKLGVKTPRAREFNSVVSSPAVAHPKPSRIPLPWQTETRQEGSMYILLAVLALGTLGHELWTSFQMAGNWHNFVELVRQLLA